MIRVDRQIPEGIEDFYLALRISPKPIGRNKFRKCFCELGLISLWLDVESAPVPGEF